MIGYRHEAGRAVVVADPLCADHDMPVLMREFHAYAQGKFKGVVYTLASPRFIQIALDHGIGGIVQIGHELVLNPMHNVMQEKGSTARKLRNKYSHAQREGVTLKEYQPLDPVLERKLEEMTEQWLKMRTGIQASHSAIDPFAHRDVKRWFYAEHNNALVRLIFSIA